MRYRILTFVAVLSIAAVDMGPYVEGDGLVQRAAAAPLEEEQQLTDDTDVAALPDRVGQQEEVQQPLPGTIGVRRSYAVKYLCGSTTAPPPGTVKAEYLTKINIHNPHPRSVVFVKKGVGLKPGQRPFPPQRFVGHHLRSDFAMEMDCSDILRLASESEGFIIIESQADLDVWAVYTARHDGGLSLDVERVPPTAVQFTRTVPQTNQPILQPNEEGD